MTDTESIEASLGAMHAVIVALIKTHPNPVALSKQIAETARDTDETMLDDRRPDSLRQKTVEQIETFGSMVDK